MQTQIVQIVKKKKKNNISSKEEGTTYCLGCRDYTHNIGPKKVTMTNKVIRENQDALIVCLVNQDI